MMTKTSHNLSNFLSVTDLTSSQMQNIFKKLTAIEKSGSLTNFIDPVQLQGLVMAPLFETPSIRSKTGFCSAFLKLGGAVLDIGKIEHRLFQGLGEENAEQIFSYLSVYCDVVVCRCYQKLLADTVINRCDVPVVSAGIYGGEHPITGLAHLYAIQKETGRLSGHNVLFITSCNSTSIASIYNGLSKFVENSFTILTTEVQPTLEGKDNLQWYDPKEMSLQDLNLSQFSLILIDESERTRLPFSILERMQFGTEAYRAATSLERIAHIKPVLKLLDDSMKDKLAQDCLNQSRLSYLTKFLIYEELLRKHKVN